MALLAVLTIEGIVCIAMALPVVAILALPGAYLGHWLARGRGYGRTRLHCAAWLLVGVAALGEIQFPAAPVEDEVSTEMVIEAPRERVWLELVALRRLPPPEEPLFILGVAHPVETLLEGGGGVGAARVCRLNTGDMPEVVTVWKPGEELRFRVLETPPPMREAAMFGRTIDTPHLHGTYLGLEGGFRLETLPDGRTKLIGFSRYSLNLAPNVYWSPWTRLIVRKVHLHVMSHVKAESEGNKATVR
jgi:hypothetical protein